MKKIFFLFVVIFITTNIYAQISDTKNLILNQLEFTTDKGYDKVNISGYDLTDIVGAPQLPVKTFSYFIPEGSKVAEISITSITEEILNDVYDVYPSQELQIPSLEGDPEFIEPDSVIYTADAYYPAQNLTKTSTLYKMGAGICGIQYCPIRYNPVTQKLKLVTHIEFSLLLENNTDQVIKPLRISINSFNTIKNDLKAFVENPTAIDAYYQISEVYDFSAISGAFHPTQKPSLRGSPVDYIIITNDKRKYLIDFINIYFISITTPAVRSPLTSHAI